MFVAPVIGLIGVFVGSRLKMKSDIKIQKDFLVREIKINKLQEVAQDMSDMVREVAYTLGLINKKLQGELSHSEYRNLNDENQEKMTKVYRGIRVKQLFLSKEYQEKIEVFYNQYLCLCDKIYEGFYATDTKNRKYKDEEITYSSIRLDTETYVKDGYEIVEELNKELLKELKALQ